MDSRTKLYIVTRRDLSPGSQAVQGMHAVCDMARHYPLAFLEWQFKSNTIVFLSAENEDELEDLIHRAHDQDIQVECFYEPDLDNALTAVAIVPDDGPEIPELCARFPLALCEVDSYRF